MRALSRGGIRNRQRRAGPLRTSGVLHAFGGPLKVRSPEGASTPSVKTMDAYCRHPNPRKPHSGRLATSCVEVCGEGGIRTLGTVTRTLDFQSSTFDHSVTSPGLGAKRAESRQPGAGVSTAERVSLARAVAPRGSPDKRLGLALAARVRPRRAWLASRAAAISSGVRATRLALGIRSIARPRGWGWL